MARPSMTSSGFFSRIVRASGLPGSASYAFATTYALPPAAAARAAASFRASGKPAPPRPRRPLASMSAMSASGPSARARSRSWAALISESRIRYAALVGKRGLQRVDHLVLVERVVRRGGTLLRPQPGDRDVTGVAAASPRDRRPLTRRRATEVRKERRGRVEMRHRHPKRLSDPLGGAPRQVAVGLVRRVEHPCQPVGARRSVAKEPVHEGEVQAPLVFRGDGAHGVREGAAVAVGSGLDHPDPVVGGARRDRRPLAERVAEGVRNGDRARRAGLLAHETRLALEDARLRLEEQRDESAAALRKLALLIRVLARDGPASEEVAHRALHAVEQAEHG